MSIFANRSIGAKLLLAFALIAFVTGIVGTCGVYNILALNRSSSELYSRGVQPLALLGQLGMASQKARVNLRGMMIDRERERMESNANSVRQRYEEVDALLLKLGSGTGDKELEILRGLLKNYRPVWEEVIRLHLDGQADAALEIMHGGALETEKQIEAAVRNLITMYTKDAELRGVENSRVAKLANSTMILFSAAGVLLAVILGFFFSRQITNPLKVAVDFANRIASGDLTHHAESRSTDETGQLIQAMNAMAEKLRGIVSQVSGTSTQLSEAASALDSTAGRIASGSEDLASQAVAVATAGEEMSATSDDIAQNCQMAAEGAQRASEAAKSGADVVNATINVMGQITAKVQESARTVDSLGARSEQIGAIIGTIEDIADQTNLLALNAAIEAARAGEQGRGFAVVADEVRALAERTARATREIGSMINTIQAETRAAVAAMESGVRQVESGTLEAARSGEALTDILQQISDVAMQVNQIATAAEEQTATTSDISNNMSKITDVVHSTSQSASESAQAAGRLNSYAEELQRLVSQFKLQA